MNTDEPQKIDATAFFNSLYEMRLLIFVEDVSLSNKYVQLRFNGKQYQQLVDFITTAFEGEKLPNGMSKIAIERGHEIFTLPDLPCRYDEIPSPIKPTGIDDQSPQLVQ
jgi:hypothetical protein